MGVEPQSVRFEWDGSATSKGIENGWWVAGGGLQNFHMCLGEQLLVTDIFPNDESLDQLVQALTFLSLELLRWEFFRSRGRVVHELSKQHSACCSQWTTRPP